jgi:hypothetical protein
VPIKAPLYHTNSAAKTLQHSIVEGRGLHSHVNFARGRVLCCFRPTKIGNNSQSCTFDGVLSSRIRAPQTQLYSPEILFRLVVQKGLNNFQRLNPQRQPQPFQKSKAIQDVARKKGTARR